MSPYQICHSRLLLMHILMAQSTCTIFSHDVMIPQLKTLLRPSAQEIACRDIYFKMYLLLRSALTMNRLDHFQSVAALTRSLFELLLDMKILARDKTGDAVKRYNEFP